MRSGRSWRSALAALALAVAGAALPALTPQGDGWVADPDEQFLLDVNLHRLTVGDGVRAYATPEGNCIVLGDLLTALDIAVKVDLSTRTATGWAFKKDHSIEVDAGAGEAVVRGKRESFAKEAIREVPEGWCVDSKTLGRWLDLDLQPDTSVSLLTVESDRKLPVELAIERRGRAAGLKRAAVANLAELPSVKLPYRLWRAPALEFLVNAGITYRAGSGVQVDRSASIYAAGELAAMSYTASVQSDGGAPRSIRAQLYRSDPEAGLLGPLKATRVAIGDVEGLASAFGGGIASGRGAIVTNRPLSHPGTFDRTSFEGELPPGWDAELYRNGALIAFAEGSGDGRYRFDSVELLYGDNDFDIVLYGPQGQVEHRRETLNVGQKSLPPGKFEYWAGVRQPGLDLVRFGKKTDPPPGNAIASPSAPELTLDAQFGVDKRMSVGAMMRSTLIQDERVTFVEGSVRRSFGAALAEVAGAVDSRGRMAARAQIVAKIGAVNVNAATLRVNGFGGGDAQRSVRSEHRLGVSAPIKLGGTRLPVSADLRLIERMDGTSALDASSRLGAQIGRFNLQGESRYSRELGRSAADQPAERLDMGIIGTGRIGPVRLRGAAKWDIKPQARFRSAEISGHWSASERADWEGGLAYEADYGRARARISHIRRFDTLGLAVTGEAASDGSLAGGISLNFSLDPFRGNFRPTSEKLASTGAVHARVFEDLNENGRRDAGEPTAANALITAAMRSADRATNERGEVTLGGLAPYVPIAIGIDQTSLDNPALTPAKPAQLIIPRPGVPAQVDIALVGGGAIEGFAVHDDHREYEGLDIELIGEDGQVVAVTRSDLDGYFLFERVRYGRYTLRLAATTAKAVGAPQALGASAEVSRDKPLVRMGMIIVRPTVQLASN